MVQVESNLGEHRDDSAADELVKAPIHGSSKGNAGGMCQGYIR